MPFAGNVVERRDAHVCEADYQRLCASGSYADFQNAWTAPTAEQYVHQLLDEAIFARSHVDGHLAVVTGVHRQAPAYYIAEELALSASMHVILLGKSASQVKLCRQAIQASAKKRRLPAPVLYEATLVLSSIAKVQVAVDSVRHIAGERYGGRLHVLVHAAHVGTDQAKLTDDGIEYNAGCNWIAGHLLVRELAPLLRRAAAEDYAYKPRVVWTATMAHAFGTKLDPHRLAEVPAQGGAPPGYIASSETLDDNLEPVEVTIQAADEGASYSMADQRLALARRGTQVGRSMMAVVGCVKEWQRQYPELSFCAVHPGSVATSLSTQSNWMQLASHLFRFSPSQAARSALRAALDPDFNTFESLAGAYLHADGNPWTPAYPATDAGFCEACLAAAEQVLDRLTHGYEPPSIETSFPGPPDRLSLTDDGTVDSALTVPSPNELRALAAERRRDQARDVRPAAAE